jgi:hypothetical protein
MATFTNSPINMIAGEDLARYRRVKLSGSTAVYADQADSSSYIGVTLEDAADGAPVSVALKGAYQTFKCVAADTFSAAATIYAAADGKVSDTSSGNAIGTAIDAATAANDVVEVLLDAGSSSAPGPQSLGVFSTTYGAVPFVISKTIAGAATTAIWNAAVPRDMHVVDAWSINQSADDGTWKLTNGTEDICAAVTVAASDTDIDRAADIDDAYNALEAGDTLSIVHTGTGFAATIYVLCLPIEIA